MVYARETENLMQETERYAWRNFFKWLNPDDTRTGETILLEIIKSSSRWVSRVCHIFWKWQKGKQETRGKHARDKNQWSRRQTSLFCWIRGTRTQNKGFLSIDFPLHPPKCYVLLHLIHPELLLCPSVGLKQKKQEMRAISRNCFLEI